MFKGYLDFILSGVCHSLKLWSDWATNVDWVFLLTDPILIQVSEATHLDVTSSILCIWKYIHCIRGLCQGNQNLAFRDNESEWELWKLLLVFISYAFNLLPIKSMLAGHDKSWLQSCCTWKWPAAGKVPSNYLTCWKYKLTVSAELWSLQ